MAGSIADLQNVVSQAIDAFNRGDMVAVMNRFTADAEVKSLGPRPHRTNGVIRTFTPQTAQQAINAQFEENSQFNPININFAPPNGTADQATVTGAAHWTDINGTDHIRFIFKCVFDANRGWLFQNVSGTAG
jgi:hypothetical protein